MDNKEEIKEEKVVEKRKTNWLFTIFACIMTGVIVYLAIGLGDKASKIIDPDTGKSESKEEKTSNVESNSNVVVEEKDITSAETKASYLKLVEKLEFARVDGEGQSQLEFFGIYKHDAVTVDQLSKRSMFMSILVTIGEGEWTIAGDTKTIDATAVLNKVRSLYGNSIELYKETIDEMYTFEYDEATNKYIASGGRGGEYIKHPLNYVYKVTEQGDNIYVYAATANCSYDITKEWPEAVIYTDIEGTKEYKRFKLGNNIEFKLDETNYDAFSKYKYTFVKNTDGTAKFEKIEKIK